MRSRIAIIGPEVTASSSYAQTLRNFGVHSEPFPTFDAFLSDVLQGASFDAVIAWHAPPDSDILTDCSSIVEEHGQDIPVVIIIPDELKDLQNKVALTPGIFSMHTSSSDANLVCHSVIQASAQRQLLKIIQSLSLEQKKLAVLARDLISITSELRGIGNKGGDVIERFISASFERFRGRDPEKELQKSEILLADSLGQVERIRRLILKT